MCRTFIVSLLLAVAAPSVPRAAVVALYGDPSWIVGTSASSLQALLISSGHTINLLSGLTGAEFAAGLSGADLVVFPEMVNYGQLAGELQPGALTALNGFVSGGGGMIATGDYATLLLNATFYPGADSVTVFPLAATGTFGPSYLDTAVAAGTPYAGGPGTLTVPPEPAVAINPYFFLSPDALPLYRDEYGGATALTAPVGAGHYGYLAWGYDGAVLGGLDGGWVSLLGIMANDVAAVPEPSALVLLLVGLPLLAWRQRRAGATCAA